MSTRLKQHVYLGFVALALCAAVAVAWPTPAQAQATSTESARGSDASPAHVVVRSGDSLWSISRQLLPANATPQQIYNKTARIYALNRDQIGPDPNLIYPGEVLKVARVPEPMAHASGSDQPGRGAGLAHSARDTKTAAAAEPSRETAQSTSRDISRTAEREPSGAPTHHQRPPELARAPILKPVAELSPKSASNEERWLPGGRLLVAAAVGTGIGWGAICLILAVVFLMTSKQSPRRTTRHKHGRWEIPTTQYRRNGWHQRRPEAAPPAPDPSPAPLGRPAQKLAQQLRTPPPKPNTRTTKGGGSQW